jgi:hypothetical protein
VTGSRGTSSNQRHNRVPRQGWTGASCAAVTAYRTRRCVSLGVVTAVEACANHPRFGRLSQRRHAVHADRWHGPQTARIDTAAFLSDANASGTWPHAVAQDDEEQPEPMPTLR